MSTQLPDTTVPDEHRQKYESNTRVCELCGEDIPHGIVGMSEHIETEHIQEDIVEELSRPWRPSEPRMFHHPDGESHIVWSYDRDFVETRCGLIESRVEVSSSMYTETWLNELISYAWVDADRYCQTCIRLQERRPHPLPGPLKADQDGGTGA